jgi:predicted ribosome quality control (RQC) complex YloA/Tae2 family protein
LATYFSKARQSANVPVDNTRWRHVKKPAGAKPGFVIYDQQKTLYVTPDEDTVRRLLEAGER